MSQGSDLPPEYVPLRRARATSDADHKPPLRRLIENERVRKWSFPLSLLRRNRGPSALAREASMSPEVPVHRPPSQDSGMDTEDFTPLISPMTPPQAQHKRYL